MVNKKILIGGINQDDAYVLVDTKEYLNALNMRFATSENGKVGQLSNIEGTTLENTTTTGTFTLPAGTNTTIGAYEDTPNRRVIFFNHNSSGSHGIYCYDADTDLVYTVVLSSQIVGGLNFATTNLIHSIAVVNDLMYWTDNRNWPRRINIEAGIKLNHNSYSTSVAAYVLDKNSTGGSGTTHMSSSVINLVRNQPWAPLTVAKVTDTNYVNNLIKDGAFQFSYRFVYRDGEVSTFSPLSKLINFNLATDSANDAIDVTIPLAQKIEQDVTSIEVAVKFMIGGSTFIIRTINSGFANHNAGTTAITFRFYNDVVGVAVDGASAVKLFDSVPLYSKTLDAAKNRLFLANNTDGYTAPTTTSLSISTVLTNATTLTGQWYALVYVSGVTYVTMYYLNVPDASTGAGFYTTTQPTSLTANVAWSAVTGPLSKSTIISNFSPGAGYTLVSDNYTGNTITFTGSPPTPVGMNGTRAFKSDASYSAGIIFFDESGRNCGVVTNSTIKVTTADRAFTLGNYTSSISWILNNDNATTQIPSWATHYSVVRTKCLRTDFFVQVKTNDITYAVRNATTGAITFNNSYDPAHYGIALKLSGLFNNGLGYEYQEGDVLKLYITGSSTLSLKIKEKYGEYVIVDLSNIGGTSGVNGLVEIYTPYFQNSNEPYYEVGQTFSITNPGTVNRVFSTLTGFFDGDVFMLNQLDIPSGTYLCEVMSPTNKFWKYWFTDIGRPSVVLADGQIKKPVTISYSNVIVLGTKINGLSTFESTSQYSLPIELKQIQRLSLTSKVQYEGTVMLAIGEQETASVYIGEAQVFDNTGNSFLATTTGVIGNVNVMRGSFGTINPESSVKYMGNVYWFDANKGSVVRYSVNGLFPISSNKMEKYFRKIGQDIIKNNLNIYGGFDPYNNEFLIFAPRKTVIPQNTVISDMVLSSQNYSYSGTQNVTVTVSPGRLYIITLSAGVTATYKGEAITGPFIAYEDSSVIAITAASSGTFTLSNVMRSYYDAYDGQGGVWAYQPDMDKWMSLYSYRPDWMSMVGNRLVSFKSGMPYVHNSSTLNTFYGQAYDSAVAFVHNEAGDIVKSYLTVSVEGDTPDLFHCRTESPNVQSTDIRGDEFEVKEGVRYASIRRDRLSPAVSGTPDQKTNTGDRMKGDFGLFQSVFFIPSSNKLIKFVNIKSSPSRGHSTQNEE